MNVFNRLYSRAGLSAITPQPHIVASPLTSAATLSRRSRLLITQTGSFLKGLLSTCLNIYEYIIHAYIFTFVFNVISNCPAPMRETLTWSTWTKYVSTTRVCRNTQPLTRSAAAVQGTSVPPARSCSQPSGSRPQLDTPTALLCRLFACYSSYL